MEAISTSYQLPRAERQLQHLPAATAAAVVAVRPSRRILKALHQALSLQALDLAYEAGPFATYDVPAWASGCSISGGGLISSRSDQHGHRR